MSASVRMQRQNQQIIKLMNRVVIHLDRSQLGTDGLVIELKLNNALKCKRTSKKNLKFLEFMEEEVDGLVAKERKRTSENYRAAMYRLREALGGKDCYIKDFDKSTAEKFREYLTLRNISVNTISFYIRIARAVYNKAVSKGLTADNMPFKNLHIHETKTNKRALPPEELKQLKAYQPTTEKELFAKDMFFFSFYAQGMSMIDMAQLDKTIRDAQVINYTRRKTGHQIIVYKNRQMDEIIDRYQSKTKKYLLPLNEGSMGTRRNTFRYNQQEVNKELKNIGKRLELSVSLTMYVARHSWASMARHLNVPLTIISKAMGHESEKTTQIYLKNFESDAVMRASQRIIREIEG